MPRRTYRTSRLGAVYTRHGRGEPLVLVHGLGHRRQAWDPVLPRLTRHREVIALDLPGFGESPPLPAGESYDVPTAMARFAELFAELGLGAPHVAGGSLGGALVLELGARGMVSSVTALAPAGFWTPLERRWALTLLTTTRMSARVPDIVLRRVAADERVRTSMIQLLYAHPERQHPDAFLGDARALKASAGFAPMLAFGRSYACTAEPDVATTVAWGTRDRVLPPLQAARARRRLPRATHVALRGCGHVPMVDDPALVARVLLAGSASGLLTSAA